MANSKTLKFVGAVIMASAITLASSPASAGDCSKKRRHNQLFKTPNVRTVVVNNTKNTTFRVQIKSESKIEKKSRILPGERIEKKMKLSSPFISIFEIEFWNKEDFAYPEHPPGRGTSCIYTITTPNVTSSVWQTWGDQVCDKLTDFKIDCDRTYRPKQDNWRTRFTITDLELIRKR